MGQASVSIRELKSRLSHFLRLTKAGESLIITDRGTPIGRIVPIVQAGKPDARTAIARLHKLSKGVRLGNIRLRDLIEEGRKS